MYNVVEKFISINGEGQRSGELSVFIRFKGCNLKCGYCDTKWANTNEVKEEKLSIEEIKSYVLSTGIKNVTLTGGEPMCQRYIYELLEELSLLNEVNIEIETNGSVCLEKFDKLKNRPCFTMDYKLPSSEMEDFMVTDNFRFMRKNDTVKFVISNIVDMERAKVIIDSYGLLKKCNIYFSPVYGVMDAKNIVKYLIENKLNGVRLQLQIHKYIWEPTQRGV